MKKNSKTFIVVLILGLIAISASAQQSRVDSVLQILTEIRLADDLDTAKLYSLRDFIGSTIMTDEQIGQLESAGSKLDEKGNKSLNYIMRLAILNALIDYDTDKAIAYGQKYVDELEKATWPYADWAKNFFLRTLRFPYRNSDRVEDGITYFSKKVVDAKSKNDTITLAGCHYVLGGFYSAIALNEQAIYNMQKSISYMNTAVNPPHLIFFDPVGKRLYLNNHHVLGLFYAESGEYQKALALFSFVKENTEPTNSLRSTAAKGAAETYLAMDSLQYVPELIQTARDHRIQTGTPWPDFEVVLNQMESLYHIKSGNFIEAEALIVKSWDLVRQENIPPAPAPGTVNPDYYSALLEQAQENYREAIVFLEKDIERVANLRAEVLKDYKLKAELYLEVGDGKEAAEAYATYIDLQDETLKEQAAFRKNSFELEQQMSARELSIANLENENKVAGLIRNFTIGLAALLLALALLVYNRYRTKQRDNQLLSATLSDLKSTQSQLIQSEKMASLGELTAGIAHEIQNPLNFVNNFSEVSNELIDEMAEEMAKGDMEEAAAIAADIKQNLEKITHHGKRADAIVKGMLAHSRAGKGEKEPTDLNALAEEYLKLSYHGLRARDKSFNADFKTDFDPDLPKVNVVPQDIGRVLLNLINNAFQACAQSDTENPLVEVKTERATNNELRITITDNGLGIPADIKEKIFQPFFTNKPTGQGTGLGLSLSYDIVKAHGGEITCVSKAGKGTEFIVKLPQNL